MEAETSGTNILRGIPNFSKDQSLSKNANTGFNSIAFNLIRIKYSS